MSYLAMFWRDVFFALRTMRRQRAFAATAVLTLALAIGGNTAAFSVIRAVLLKPLPYPDSDRLVRISGGATPSRFAEMKASARSFSGIGAFTGEESPTLAGGAEAVVLKGARVSANFLQILGVNPLMGRAFRTEEDSPGGAPVVMISAALWQERFGGDARILGKTATLAGVPYTIIGVLPPRFSFPSPDVDVWMTAPTEWPVMPPKTRALSPFLSLFGRLKPNITIDEATAEAKVIHRQYARAHPAMLDAKPNRAENVTAMKDSLVANVRAMLWMLFGAVGFVLAIACANVASLLLARGTLRSREMAVRSALGAARLRLMAQLTAESMVLSLLGGTLGVLLAGWLLRGIPGITAIDLPRAGEIHMDWAVLGFAAALSIGTGMLFGLAPAVGASRPDLVRMLRVSGAGASGGAGRGTFAGLNARAILLVMQVALSIVLLIGTALLIESVSRLRGVSVGFNPANVLTASISLPISQYGTDEKKSRFIEQLTGRLRTQAGVRSAAAAMFLPMMSYAGSPVQDASKPLLKLNERLIATMLVVSPEYFHTLEIPLRRGRDFNERDKGEAQRVAIIDETTARHFWPDYPRGQDPIGQHLLVGGVNAHPAQIVGIAADIHQSLEKSAWPETVYLPFAQDAQPFATVAIRTEATPLGFAAAVREQVRGLDKNLSVSAVRTMDDLVEEQVGQRRLLATLLGSFAAMALLLVLMGIYGIIAYSVAQRTQEIGIRRALGAQPVDILWLVVGQSLRLALAGIAVGAVGAFGLTRLMEGFLFHVSATDPLTFVIVALLFLGVALAASYLPARRAARIDPMAALRV